MSPKKLSDEEKTELVHLYRQTDQTTATLAKRFQVSSSTVSRVLRNNLSHEEYENLIHKKRHNRQKNRLSSKPNQEENTVSSEENKISQQSQTSHSLSQEQSNNSASEATSSETSSSHQQVELSFSSQESSAQNNISVEQDEPDEQDKIDFSVIQAMFGEDVGYDDDLEDSEEEDWEEEETVNKSRKQESDEVEVLPLSQAKFPKTCYLVIDRGANLITKPLKEFSDLGKIPNVETQQKTLPIFDNHRVARRFSNRSQKVIKVPDGKMIKKTKQHLEAKGIKRILMDGKVYMLS
jgi:transposase-like protein